MREYIQIVRISFGELIDDYKIGDETHNNSLIL